MIVVTPETTEARTACGSPIRAASVLRTDAALRKRFEAKHTTGAEPGENTFAGDGDRSSCWLWTAYREEKGYGCFSVGGRMLAAHRVAYALHNGEYPPPDLMVLHSCDNPGCVNPAHLRLGTATQNNRECVEKARHGNQNAQSVIVFVEKHPFECGAERWKRGTEKIMRGGSRLSKANVQEIRARVAGMSERNIRAMIPALASHYFVSRSVIRGVVSRRTFAWVEPDFGDAVGAVVSEPVTAQNHVLADRERCEREGIGEYAPF